MRHLYTADCGYCTQSGELGNISSCRNSFYSVEINDKKVET